MPPIGPVIDDYLSLIKREDTHNYVVYFKDSTNKDKTTAICNLLKGLVTDPNLISVHDSDLGVAFWSAPLTSNNAKKVEADSNVSM